MILEQLIFEAIQKHDNMALAQASISDYVGKQLFKQKAIELGIWKPGKRGEKVKLSDVLEGKHPQYHSSHLRKRLIAEGIKEAKCECCNQSFWMGQKIPLTLHHIDGNHGNNKIDNLQILCYNCHAMTENFGPLNKKLF